MNLEERVISTISKNIEKKQEITLAKNLIDDLSVDSLDTLMIISALEDEFNISINEDDFKNISTVQDIVNNLQIKYPSIEGK